MTRSLYKGFFIDSSLYQKCKKHTNSYKPIKTMSRRSMILPMFIGKTIELHNGKKYTRILITEDMVGHKLGEFYSTRVSPNHTNNNKNKKR